MQEIREADQPARRMRFYRKCGVRYKNRRRWVERRRVQEGAKIMRRMCMGPRTCYDA